MRPSLPLALVLRLVTAGCPPADHRFHGAVELVWAEDARAVARGGELPPERLAGLRDYCHCKGDKDPTDFCRSVFAAYFAKPRDMQDTPQSSYPAVQAKAHWMRAVDRRDNIWSDENQNVNKQTITSSILGIQAG
jgi:hypothetical protein